jgi:hypothetical protein
MKMNEVWSVDLERRRVSHVSGAEASFSTYHTEEDWHASDVASLRNPDLYEDGSRREFARKAKQVAMAAGMKRNRPSVLASQ